MLVLRSNASVPIPTPEGEVFGRTIRRLRQEQELTQEKLAAFGLTIVGSLYSLAKRVPEPTDS